MGELYARYIKGNRMVGLGDGQYFCRRHLCDFGRRSTIE